MSRSPHGAVRGLTALLAVGLSLLLYWCARNRGSDRTATRNATRPASHDPAAGASRTPATPTLASRPVLAGLSREHVLDVMNGYRERHGLGPLRLDPKLNAAADDRLRDMFRRRYFDHVAPDGTQPYVWVRRRGYRYARIAENLAMGHESAQEVVDEWMGSAQHRANALGEYEEIGVGFAEASPTGKRRGYTFVVLFAAR